MTADQFVAALRQALSQTTPGGDEVFLDPRGKGGLQPLGIDRHSFKIVALQRYIQIIPRGLYDTIYVSVAMGTTTALALPLFIAFETLNSEEGQFAMGMAPGPFILLHPPAIAQTAQVQEQYIQVAVPLTNSPFIVWADDGVNPAGSDTWVVTVTPMRTNQTTRVRRGAGGGVPI